MELSKRTLRRIRNMAHICDFDTDAGIALVKLHYKTPDELVDVHLSRPGVPVVSDEAVDYLRAIIADIPKEFKVDFSLTIDDYGAYSHVQLLNSLRATIENTFYYHDEARKKDSVLAVVFIIAGILFLSLEVAGGLAGWYGAGGSLSRSIIETVLDVFVWALIWEGGALLLLTYENDSTLFSRDMKRFHGVRFNDAQGVTLSAIDREQLYKGWIYLGTREAFARSFILFSNAALLALLSVEIMECVTGIEAFGRIGVFGFIVSWLLLLALALSNIGVYREKGRLRKIALPLTIAALALNIMSVFFGIFTGRVGTRYFVLDCLFIVFLAANLVCLMYMRKLHVRIES